MIDAASMTTPELLNYRAQALLEASIGDITYAQAEVEIELYERELARRPIRREALAKEPV